MSAGAPRSLLLAAAAVGVALGWPRLPGAAPADAPAEAFSASRAMVYVRAWAARPRPSGSAEQARVLAAIEAELVGLGFQVQRQGPPGLVNLVAGVPGDGPDGVWLVAHSDSVAAGPGAADDGLGLAVTVEAARALGPRPGLHLLLTDAEEEGLVGAQAFVAQAPAARRVVLNVEARGTEGPAYMFQTAGPVAPLLEAWTAAGCRAQATSLAKVVYDAMPNDTDFTVFREAGWWGYDFALIGGAWRYHTADDTAAHLDPRSVQMVGDCVAGVARQWLEHPPQGEGARVYGQVAGRTLSAPPALVRLLGLAPLLLLGRPERLGGALLGGAAWVGALVLAAALGMAQLVAAVALWPEFLRRPAEVVQPGPLWATAAAAGLGSLAIGRALAARVPGGDWGWAAANVATAAALAVALPEAGYLLVPGAWAAVALRRRWGAVATAAVLVAATALTPAFYAFYPALTSRMAPVLAVLPALLLGWVPRRRP